MHARTPYHENDFSKTILEWSFEILATPLHIAMRQAPLPRAEQNIARFYGNFLPLILEEARAIIAAGLEKIDQYTVQSSKKGKGNISHLSDAKPFNLRLKKNVHLPRNEGNPLLMPFSGAIPDKIEHGKSMNVLLLRTKGISPERKFIALATENNNASELFIKIIISSSDYDSYESCFVEGRQWQAQYLGSVVSEQRMYDVCLEARDISCVQQIARSQIQTPRTASVSTGSVDINHLNLSQREAIYAFLNAREGSTLLLQGPPGTGKTTTVVSLLKLLALQHKRTMVSAHSNKGVQVLALRAVGDMPDVPMILVGVESKLHDKLKPIFLNRWHDIICSHFSSYHDEIELLATNPSSDVGITISVLITEISDHINEAQQTLRKFNLIHTRRASEMSRTALSLSNDPLLMSDFQTTQSHINELKTQSQSKNKWTALLGSLNRLMDKWSRISKADLEAYLLDHAEIVFSTLIAAGRKSMLTMEPIDYLLVDEAAQSVEAATLIPMRFQPDKVLLVGDTKQLPATVISAALDDSPDRHSSSHYKWSMMWRLIEECNQPSLMLTIQYRMHPQICQWPSSQYYADRLITSPDILPMPSLSNTSITSRPYAIYQISGHAESLDGSHSICNTQEAQYVIKIIEHIRRQNKEQTIGVITPYAAQKRLIMDSLSKKRQLLPLVDVNTVDGFQGDERDIIIISFTRTHVSEFLKEFRRLNVAITRPKNCLIILGAATLLSNDIGQLMTDAKLRKALHSEQDLKNILATGTVPSLALQSNLAVDMRASAWQGHSRSQFYYAESMAEIDRVVAFLWYRRAAENNDPEAQYYISHLYLSDNIIVKKDMQLGIAWLHKAAQQQLPLAQFVIGQHFLSGSLIVKNVAAGISWCEQAATQNLVTAIVFLAKCHEEGLHLAQNMLQAQNYYRRAAKLDDLPSAIKLATLLANGTPDNQKEAIKWYRKTAERNVTSTYYPLAVLLNSVLNNQIEALQWYLKAAENGDIEAQYELGLRFKHGYHNCNIDTPKSTYFFKLAAVSGHTHAQFIYATCLNEGSGVEKNQREAMVFFQKAADNGHIEAQYQFALLKSQESKSDAYPYFLKAAQQNHFLAQYECIAYQIQYGRDLTYCLHFCEQLALQDNHTVQFLLARLLDTGIAGKTDKTQALRYYLQVTSSHPQAQYYCAIILEDGVGVSKNLTQARQYYEACLDLCPEAKPKLARLLLQAETYKDHEVRAIELLKFYYANFQQAQPSTLLTLEGQLESLILSRASNSRTCFIYSIATHSIYANYSLGMMLKEGAGVTQNNSEAMIFLKKAADKGDAESQYQFALLKSQQSKDEAYVYFKKAALQQHVLAQNECIDHQITFNCDLAICLIFCKELAANGNHQAQFILARFLDTGITGEMDKNQAYHYYSQLADNGHAFSQYYCALLLEQGVDVPQDLTRARFYYESSMAQCFSARFRLACLLLKEEHNDQQRRAVHIVQDYDDDITCLPRRKEGATYRHNTSTALTKDQAKAIELLEFYCDHYSKDKPILSDTLGHRVEQLMIEHYGDYIVNRVPVITTHAIQANYYLGRIFQEGKGVAIDIQRALQHYRSASTQNADASYRAGYIYESGLNVAKNWPMAKSFYQSAADKGHRLAAMRLTWSYSLFSSSNNPPSDATLLENEGGKCVIS